MPENASFPAVGDGQDVVWVAQPGGQRLFLCATMFEVLFEGPRGGGKTDGLLIDFLQHVGPIKFPGHKANYGAAWNGILFRRTYEQLSDIIKKSRKWVPKLFPGSVFVKTPYPTWHFPTGESLMFRRGERAEDYWDYHGHEYPWMGFEELTTWPTDAFYRRVISLCRSPMPGMPRKLRATTNPYGPGHSWVKERFGLPRLPGRVSTDPITPDGEESRCAVHSSLEDNRILLASDPNYRRRILMSADSEAVRQAWIDGDWNLVVGGMFADVWRPDKLVIQPFDIPHSWRVDRSFDWGDSAPFSVGWWAESDGSDVRLRNGRVVSTVRGDLFRIAEWYGFTGKANEGVRMLAVDIAAGIIEREMADGIHGRVKPGPADNSIFDVSNGQSIAVDMMKPQRVNGHMVRGVTWVKANKSPGARASGYNRIRTMMRNAVRDPGDPPREHPGMFIFEQCSQFIRTIPILERDTEHGKPDDTPKNAEDHIADEVRYRVLSGTTASGSNKTSGMAS